MSTKSTLSINSFVHVYEDFISENVVTLSFRFNDSRIENTTIHLDVESAAVIYAGLHSKMKEVMKTYGEDSESIAKRVKGAVEKRAGKKGVYAIFGSEIYGSSDDDQEVQIRNGIEYFTRKKEDLAKMVDKAIHDIDDKSATEAIKSLIDGEKPCHEKVMLKKFSDLMLMAYEKNMLKSDSEEHKVTISALFDIAEDISCDSANLDVVEKSIDKLAKNIMLGSHDSTPSLFEERPKE